MVNLGFAIEGEIEEEEKTLVLLVFAVLVRSRFLSPFIQTLKREKEERAEKKQGIR
jgi:hypothetical protein